MPRNAEAADLLEEVVRLFSDCLGPEHPSTLMIVSNLAVTLKAQGKLDQAETLERYDQRFC